MDNKNKTIRSPICTCVGHVDHGKSSILDWIRGTAIVDGEPGKITQSIGASIIPLDCIKKATGSLLENLNINFTIPGILFIDTPGHAAFTNLRKRGGNLADIAILVIDIKEGFKPQTIEALDILRSYKTPFIVAANKLDLVPGWQNKDRFLLKSIEQQSEQVKELLDKKLYELVGKFSEYEMNSERFDRVDDYAKNIALVPCSAKTGEGIPELLMVLTGLVQKYMETCLHCDTCGKAKGTVLEVKESKGHGICVDAIIYDGCLDVNDTVVIGGIDDPIVTKVRALLEPAPLAEMRDKKSRFISVPHIMAATGVKISAPDLKDVVAGMPIRSCDSSLLDDVKKEVRQEVEEVLVETDREGIVIKADSLGSLEALINLLKENDILIKKASIGNISKKDLSEAESSYEKDPLHAVVLGFGVGLNPDVIMKDSVKVITSEVIYQLIDDFEKWQEEEKKRQEAAELDNLVRPCKMEIMRGYIFRQNNPAVVGVDILEGSIKVGMPIMKEGKVISLVKSLQLDKKSVNKSEKGKQLAVAMPNLTVGRQINEGDTLYSGIPEDDFRKLREFRKYLSKEDVEVLKEIAELMRKDNPLWGV